MNDSKGSHLSVIVDLSPIQWHLSALPHPTNSYPLSLSSFLSQLIAFLNAHVASKHENSLAVFGAFPKKSLLLYSSTDTSKENQAIDANTYPPFKLVNTTVVKRIVDELDSIDDFDDDTPTSLVGAFTKALCYVNRISLPSSSNPSNRRQTSDIVDPRILILSVSPDQSTSYIPIMNSIFSAQKLKVTVDVCQIYGPDTVFLQQAAHLTGGSYIYLERRDALLQYLTMSFLSSPSIRRILAVPTQDKVDFRAACFCHKSIIDIGFVCSVCLSIFCAPVPVCSTCRTKFPIKTLQRLNASRPLQAISNPPTSPNTRPSPGITPAISASAAITTTPQSARNRTGELPHSAAIGNGTPSANGSRH